MAYDPKHPIIFQDHLDIFNQFFDKSESMKTAANPTVPNPAGGTSFNPVFDGELFDALPPIMPPQWRASSTFAVKAVLPDHIRHVREQKSVVIYFTDGEPIDHAYREFIRDGASL